MRKDAILVAAVALVVGSALSFGIPEASAGDGPQWCHNEAYNAQGENQCSSNSDCDGERTCSSAGWCQGTSRTSVAVCLPPKFYRQSDQPEVYYQFRSDMHCHVQNEGQMAAFGGFDQVTIVTEVSMAGQFTGGCGWPNGFYRAEDRPEVYRLTGDNGLPNMGNDICHVVNEQQMAAFGGFGIVQVVQAGSDIGRGRGTIMPCANP